MRIRVFGWTVCIAVAMAFPVRAAVPRPDHVVIVVEENHSYSSIMGSSSAPFINSLAAGGASFDQFFAITHPSQPNYLDLFSGSNQGVTDDSRPGNQPFTTPNLASALRTRGYSFTGYSESLPSVGYNGDTWNAYARKHNPWANWQSATPTGNQLPLSVNQPLATFPASGSFSLLPSVSIVVPNLDNDMHDGSIAGGDAWLKSHFAAYNDWAKTHNSMLVVTFDEDDSSGNNRVATIFSGQLGGKTVGGGAVIHSSSNTFNLLRTVTDMYGAAAPGAAGGAGDLAGLWSTSTTTASTRSFRNGAAGYSASHDNFLTKSAPKTAHGTASTIVANFDSQPLIRFDNLIGSGASQIPAKAKITAAKLTLTTTGGSVDGSSSTFGIFRMFKSWNDASTWDSLGGGVSADGIEAAKTADSKLVPLASGKPYTFNVAASLQAWANGAPNLGWAILTTPNNAWRWNSDEASNLPLRPLLQVSYTTPSGAAASLVAVPEPACLPALLIAAAIISFRRSRQTGDRFSASQCA